MIQFIAVVLAIILMVVIFGKIGNITKEHGALGFVVRLLVSGIAAAAVVGISLGALRYIFLFAARYALPIIVVCGVGGFLWLKSE